MVKVFLVEDEAIIRRGIRDSSAVFSLYLLYKSTSYISIKKSTSGSLCVPDVLL